MFGGDLALLKPPEYLEACEYTVVAVKLSAARLGIDMASSSNCGSPRLCAFATRKNIAETVNPHHKTSVPKPLAYLIARTSIQIAQGKPADTILRGCANCSERHQAVPETAGVHFQQSRRSVESCDRLARGDWASVSQQAGPSVGDPESIAASRFKLRSSIP